MTGFSPQPNQGRRGPRQRGTVGGDGSRSPTNPGRSRSIPATRTVSGPGELRFLVRPEDAGWTATGMQPKCPGPAPWDSHDAVRQPASLGCVRA